MTSILRFFERASVWFALALCALMAIAYVNYRNINNLMAESAWVAHTHQVLETLGQTLSNLKDIQSATRGYLLTGQQDYLVPYENALPLIGENLGTLEFLTRDNPVQQARVTPLRKLVAARLATAAETIRLYNEESHEAAVDFVRGGQGKKEMGEIRQVIRVMENEENLLLERRQGSAKTAAYTTLVMSAVGFIACLAILAMVFSLVRREGLRRKKSEAELQQALERTEMIVRDTKSIGQVGDFLQGCRSEEEALAFIGEKLPDVFAGSSGALFILNNSHDLLERRLRWGAQEGCPDHFPPEECWGLRRGRVHVAGGGRNTSRCTHAKNDEGSALCVPMMAHGETTGVLYLSSSDPDYLDEYRVEMIRTVTEQISLALANLSLQETLRSQSIRDSLTKLFNRRYMEVTLTREFSRARREKRPVSVMMIDIDHFKRFNDSHGHEAGDLVLSEMGKLLARLSRTEDIACRYGGEEFLVVLPGAGLEDAQKRAELIRSEAQKIALQHNRETLAPITLSIGLAAYPQNAEQSEDVVAAADTALYAAKKEGRNRVSVAAAVSNLAEAL